MLGQIKKDMAIKTVSIELIQFYKQSLANMEKESIRQATSEEFELSSSLDEKIERQRKQIERAEAE